jgi:hypothetical protein
MKSTDAGDDARGALAGIDPSLEVLARPIQLLGEVLDRDGRDLLVGAVRPPRDVAGTEESPGSRLGAAFASLIL